MLYFLKKFFVCFHSILWRRGKAAFLADTNLNLTRYAISSLICVAQPSQWWWQCRVAISYRRATVVALLSQGHFHHVPAVLYWRWNFSMSFFFPLRETLWNECAYTVASVTCLRQWWLSFSCAWGCQTRIRSPVSGVKAKVSADPARSWCCDAVQQWPLWWPRGRETSLMFHCVC